MISLLDGCSFESLDWHSQWRSKKRNNLRWLTSNAFLQMSRPWLDRIMWLLCRAKLETVLSKAPYIWACNDNTFAMYLHFTQVLWGAFHYITVHPLLFKYWCPVCRVTAESCRHRKSVPDVIYNCVGTVWRELVRFASLKVMSPCFWFLNAVKQKQSEQRCEVLSSWIEVWCFVTWRYVTSGTRMNLRHRYIAQKRLGFRQQSKYAQFSGIAEKWVT